MENITENNYQSLIRKLVVARPTHSFRQLRRSFIVTASKFSSLKEAWEGLKVPAYAYYFIKYIVSSLLSEEEKGAAEAELSSLDITASSLVEDVEKMEQLRAALPLFN